VAEGAVGEPRLNSLPASGAARRSASYRVGRRQRVEEQGKVNDVSAGVL